MHRRYRLEHNPHSLDLFIRCESSARSPVKEQLERLVWQMYKGGIRYSEAVREFERTFLATVLREHNANQVRAATQLGMHRNTLRRQISKLELDVKKLRVARRRPPLRAQIPVGPTRAKAT